MYWETIGNEYTKSHHAESINPKIIEIDISDPILNNEV